MSKLSYHFTTKLWQHQAQGGWYFLTLPIDISTEIRESIGWQEEGWGRLKTRAQIQSSTWDTAVWFDSKTSCYLLAVKADIRKKCNLKSGDRVSVKLLF